MYLQGKWVYYNKSGETAQRGVSMEKAVRLGIIGLGNMGTQHMRYCSHGKVTHGKVTAVADLLPQKDRGRTFGVCG